MRYWYPRRVLLALVPDRTRDRERRDRRQHSFVEHRRHHRPVLITSGKACGGRASTLNLPFHSPAQRDCSSCVPEHQVQLLRLAHEPAIRLGLQHPDRDHIPSRLQHARRRNRRAGFRPTRWRRPGPVDVDRIHALDRAEENKARPAGSGSGSINLSAEPDHRRRSGTPSSLKPAGNVTDFQPESSNPARPSFLCARVVLVVPAHDVVAVLGAPAAASR